MYELNKPYTKKELAEEVLGITAGTLKNNSTLYMNHLKEYFEIKVIPNGRWEKYMLTKEIKPWETYREKLKRENHSIIEDYRDAADVVISKQPRQTFSSIADKIDLYNINNINTKYEHAKETKRRNVGKAVKEYYIPKNGAWCEKLDNGDYRPITADEKDLFYALQDEYKAQYYDEKKGGEKFKIMNQYRNGELSEKEYVEADEKIYGSWYKAVMEEFKSVYGYKPIWVKEWEKDKSKWGEDNAWE